MLDGLNITFLKPTKRFPFVRYRLDVRARVGGILKRKIETIEGGTKQQAKERYYELLAGLRTDLPTPVKNFGDLLGKYLEHRGAEIPIGERTIFDCLTRDLGNVRIIDLPDALERYSATIRKSISKKTGKRFANGSINRHRAMIAATFNLAMDRGILDKNPLRRSIFPKLKEIPRDRVLSHEEALRLFNILEKEAPHLVPAICFALQMPVRRAELLNMRREDLDIFNNAIRVHNGTTKNDEGSWKRIPPNMVPYFRNLPSDCPYLFYRLKKGVYKPLGVFKNTWKRCLRLAGIPDFRFHDTRHNAVTGLADAGTPERVVMDMAGWRTNMLRTYYHHSKKKSLDLVIFPDGNSPHRVLSGYAQREGTDKSGEFRLEAVSKRLCV